MQKTNTYRAVGPSLFRSAQEHDVGWMLETHLNFQSKRRGNTSDVWILEVTPSLGNYMIWPPTATDSAFLLELLWPPVAKRVWMKNTTSGLAFTIKHSRNNNTDISKFPKRVKTKLRLRFFFFFVIWGPYNYLNRLFYWKTLLIQIVNAPAFILKAPRLTVFQLAPCYLDRAPASPLLLMDVNTASQLPHSLTRSFPLIARKRT